MIYLENYTINVSLLSTILIVLFPFFSGNPASDAQVILMEKQGRKQVALQETGEKGKAAFHYLKEGSYSLGIRFPQQEGKWIKERPRHQTLTKATFNEKKQIYYYQGREGYFSVRYTSRRRMDRQTFKAVFRENKSEEGNTAVIADFSTKRKGAKLELQVRKLTARKFKKKTRKIRNDISMISIRGVR